MLLNDNEDVRRGTYSLALLDSNQASILNCSLFIFEENIEVNPDDPDDHFQFKIYPCLEMEGVDGKRRFEGYFISLESDIRWYLKDSQVEWYSCRIFSSNQLLVCTPGTDYDFEHSRDFIHTLYDLDGDDTGNIQLADDALESIDAYNNRLDEEENLKLSRKFKWYILTFPRDVVLSVKEIFDNATEDNYLDGEPLTVRTFHDQREGIVGTRTFCTWKVIDKSRGSRKIGPGDRKPTSKMAAKLGLSIPGGKGNTAVASYKHSLNA